MAEEVKIGDETKEVTPPLEPKVELNIPPKEPEENPEVRQKADQLANLNKAIKDETDRLRVIRDNQRKAKLGIEIDEESENLPEIDLKDPSSKAWDKRIRETTAPVQKELEKAKEERRLFTLRQFLADKPSLAKNPQKITEMMETYDRLKTSTELTNEGIQMDLEKAYAATHADELISAARNGRVDDARNDAIFADIAVSRGSTAYSDDKKPAQRVYSEDEKAQLAKWGMTPAEHAALVASQQK